MLWTTDVPYKLDTTPPDVVAEVNGFELTVSATDPLPAGAAENSGLASCQFRVEQGSWADCEPTVNLGASVNDRTVTVVATDHAGNETTAEVLAANQCTETYHGSVRGGLHVTDGIACLGGATVTGGITVGEGASLVAENSRVNGGVTTSDAYIVSLGDVRVSGATTLTGTTGWVTVTGSQLQGSVRVDGSLGSMAPDLSFTSVRGDLSCSGNEAGPVLTGTTVTGDALGQCAP